MATVGEKKQAVKNKEPVLTKTRQDTDTNNNNNNNKIALEICNTGTTTKT